MVHSAGARPPVHPSARPPSGMMNRVNKKRYYKILQIPLNSSQYNIRKAYKILALKYHPDKNPHSEERFKHIVEAYRALMDNSNDDDDDDDDSTGRTVDRHVTDFLKFSRSFSQTQRNVENIPVDIRKRNFFNLPDHFNNWPTGRSSTISNNNSMIFKTLEVTLEEIASGTVKTFMMINNDINGNISKKEIKIEIKPGWVEGTRITFHPEGVSFVLKEKPHPIFQRDGSNLIYTWPISFRDALCGSYDDKGAHHKSFPNKNKNNKNKNKNKNTRSIKIPSNLNGSETITLHLAHDEIIKPQTIKILPGLGLPTPTDYQTKGDIIVKFDVQFPNTLTRNMKSSIAKFLDF